MGPRPKRVRQLLAFFADHADRDGVFNSESGLVGARFGIESTTVRAGVRRLLEGGAIERVGRGRYRITGRPYKVPPRAVPAHSVHHRRERKPAPIQVVPAPAEIPCTYRTARECGIEPTTWWLHERIRQGTYVGDIPITVARVPSLERPLP